MQLTNLLRFDHYSSISTNNFQKPLGVKKCITSTKPWCHILVATAVTICSCQTYMKSYKLWVGATRLGYTNCFESHQGTDTNISIQYAAYGVGTSVILEYAEVFRRRGSTAQMHLLFDNFLTTLPITSVRTFDWKKI